MSFIVTEKILNSLFAKFELVVIDPILTEAEVKSIQKTPFKVANYERHCFNNMFGVNRKYVALNRVETATDQMSGTFQKALMEGNVPHIFYSEPNQESQSKVVSSSEKFHDPHCSLLLSSPNLDDAEERLTVVQRSGSLEDIAAAEKNVRIATSRAFVQLISDCVLASVGEPSCLPRVADFLNLLPREMSALPNGCRIRKYRPQIAAEAHLTLSGVLRFA